MPFLSYPYMVRRLLTKHIAQPNLIHHIRNSQSTHHRPRRNQSRFSARLCLLVRISRTTQQTRPRSQLYLEEAPFHCSLHHGYVALRRNGNHGIPRQSVFPAGARPFCYSGVYQNLAKCGDGHTTELRHWSDSRQVSSELACTILDPSECSLATADGND